MQVAQRTNLQLLVRPHCGVPQLVMWSLLNPDIFASTPVHLNKIVLNSSLFIISPSGDMGSNPTSVNMIGVEAPDGPLDLIQSYTVDVVIDSFIQRQLGPIL